MARSIIESAWADPAQRDDPRVAEAVDVVWEGLDRGELRVASPAGDEWEVHAWVKQAILLYFSTHENIPLESGIFTYHDKVPLKHEFTGVRIVPPATVRYGAHLEAGAIVMPSYINVGAYVGANTMIDTWATVGSCAQVGRNCHVSGGVGIGGVLEPMQASPVIVEDGVFLGSRVVLTEGVRIGREAVLGAGVVLTASTPIVDVRGAAPVITKGRIPARSVAIPGSMPKQFAAGEFGVPCVLVIGERKPSTDLKTSLNQALREYPLSL
jgi:2,3,4,5-tetrahydropyridine-2-carboxylate N-succinyltransferase